jgi:hypothetical protein
MRELTAKQTRALSRLLGQYQEILENDVDNELIQYVSGELADPHDPAIRKRLARDRKRWRACEDFQMLLTEIQLMRAREVYDGSDGELTKRYYAALAERGVIGFDRDESLPCTEVLRPGEALSRRRVQRRSVRPEELVMGLLCSRAGAAMRGARNRVRVEGRSQGRRTTSGCSTSTCPPAKCSFHAAAHGEGPDYSRATGTGSIQRAERILAFCDQVIRRRPAKHPAHGRGALPRAARQRSARDTTACASAIQTRSRRSGGPGPHAPRVSPTSSPSPSRAAAPL